MNANRITRLIIFEKVSDYEEVRLYAYADGGQHVGCLLYG
jgi:hypothetical protein